ncbi:ATP-binding protein [Haloarcula onubensis]|uniref:histidine kinase n=1 Tax=Haloarcula onubensis TaxID=2950539 RepID=A0ABU2FIL8_9EURY|nr:ATP-binding protein [Halomicroarcula sp. S3CR25-11]MDS0280606.1 ATP-binding protein [Halomicroarcula sp. S3CR25-11]
MVDRGTAAELLYVGPDPDGTIVTRLRSGLTSASVTVAADLSTLDARLDADPDCVVVHHDLPDGTGFDADDLVRAADPVVPVVLLAEPTGTVAATAVERDLHGFVPLSDGRPADRLVGTVERALEGARTDLPAGAQPADDTGDVRWKADILDQLFERLPVHLYVKDADARHVRVSQAHTDDPSTVVGRSDLYSRLVPAGEASKGLADDLDVIESGESIVDREEYYASRDEWYLTSKVPRYDGDGNIVGLIGVSREITERRKAQERLEALNERLEQFVSTASHDLRNPLTVARGRVEHERDQRDSDHLAAAEHALTRMESLVDDLLTLARGENDIQRTDHLQLSAVARSCWADVPTDGATLHVETDLEFEGARGRVRQLLENLFRNAVEHSSTGNRNTQRPDDAVEHGSTTPDSQARQDAAGQGSADDADTTAAAVNVRVGALSSDAGFFVADDGTGIPESERDTVFESGYSTQDTGTGFGLSIVEDVAQAHGWTVEVTAAESGGARFEVTGLDVLD